MTEPDPAEARLIAIETRLAYQDHTIEALNAALIAQWTKIESLDRRIAEMRERLKDAEDRTPPAAVEEPPPHY